MAEEAKAMQQVMKMKEEGVVNHDIPTFDPTKKKKKKKVVVIRDLADDSDSVDQQQQQHHSWDRSDDDDDYKYVVLLERLHNTLIENNPELADRRRRKETVSSSIDSSQVVTLPGNRTVFDSFMDVCKMMHREPDHVMDFLLAELVTTGSLDGQQQRLLLKGRFEAKKIRVLLDRYEKEYVTCNACKSSDDTILSKEKRLLYIRCEKCGSTRSVSPIETGFVARVRRRRKS